MPDAPAAVPVEVPVSLSSLATLAAEVHRLTVAVPSPTAPARHALRKLSDFLAACGLETRTFDGAAYDPGLAATVLDSVPDPTLAPQTAVVDETISPLVLYRGAVLKPAEVVVRTGPAK